MLKYLASTMGTAAIMLAGMLGLIGTSQAATDFPTKPVTLLVGFGAGGGTDVVSRKIAAEMEKVLGQPVVVVNKPGGGGLVSWKELVASKPDGYTISTLVVANAFIQKYLETSKAWIDPLKDVRFLGMVNSDYWGVAVKKDAPYEDVPGFVAWTKKNPGAKVSDGGPATAYHWAWVALEDNAGAAIKTVTYKGATAGGLKAVAGGEVVAAGASPAEADSMAKAGLVKRLGVAAPERLPQFADVPTFKEQGIDFVWPGPRGFVAPAGTPDEVVAVLADAVKKAYESKSYQDFLTSSGHGGLYLNPEDGAKFLAEQDERFKSLMAKAGVLRK